VNINAGILRRIARLAYDRTNGSPDRAVQINMDGIVAVLFSASATEAFINELVALARMCPATDPNCLRVFATLASQAVADKVPIRFKYEFAHTLFAGSGYDKGSEPYQSFDLLFKARDTFAHLKIDQAEFDIGGTIRSPGYSTLLDRFRSQNILAQIDLARYVNAAPSLFEWFSTRAVARWACNTASEIVFSILDSIPDSQLKDQAEFFYRDNFRHVS
jgi:hypothetical protein